MEEATLTLTALVRSFFRPSVMQPPCRLRVAARILANSGGRAAGALPVSAPNAWSAMLGAALGALWFLPLGTLFSVVQVALLLLLRRRLA